MPREWGSANNCTCLSCGKEFHRKPYSIKIGENKYCSRLCYSNKKSELMVGELNHQFGTHWQIGENNPNWKGGVITNGYTWDWPKIKKIVKIRDRYICRLCFKDQENVKRKHAVHHIDGNKNNNSLDNLITICCSCHCKIHKPHLNSPVSKKKGGAHADPAKSQA